MHNLSSIVHSLHAQKSADIPTLKKSHCYELISAFLGFKSYAAFKKSFTQLATTSRSSLSDQHLFVTRAISMGFSDSDADALRNAIDSYVKPDLQAKLKFDFLYKQFLEHDCDWFNLPDTWIASINELVRLGLSESYLLAAVICYDVIADFYEHSDNRKGKYYSDRRANGHSLNILQAEVADNYEEVKAYFELLALLSKQLDFSTLPSPYGLKTLLRKFKYSTGDAWTQVLSQQPDTVSCAFEYLRGEELLSVSEANSLILNQWNMAETLLRPTKESINGLIHNSSSSAQMWLWHLYGLANGIDVTQDNLYAINAVTGEDYDDYGPLAVKGLEGVDLPAISESEKSKIEAFVRTISNG